MAARPSGGGGGRDAVFNHGVDLQLQIMERLGDITAEHVRRTSASPWRRMEGRYDYASSQRGILQGPARTHMCLCRDIIGRQ